MVVPWIYEHVSKSRVICPKAKKSNFLCFWVSVRKKNSSGRRSDNIDASGLPNSSSESWRPEDSENVVVFEIWRFWTGVMAAQSRKTLKFWVRYQKWEVSQKNTLSIMSFWFRNEYQLKTTLLATRSIRFGHQIPKLAECCFFVTARFF